VIYSTTPFHTIGPIATHYFLSRTTPRDKSSIRKLHISWDLRRPIPLNLLGGANFESESYKTVREQNYEAWEHVCEVVAKMPSLRELRVSIYDHQTHGWRIFEDELLAPLFRARVVEGGTFTVELGPLVSSAVFTRAADAPFLITRRLEGEEAIPQEIIAVPNGGARGRRLTLGGFLRGAWNVCTFPCLCISCVVEVVQRSGCKCIDCS